MRHTKRIPRAHQLKGTNYAIKRVGVGLFMGVGAGKTKVTIDALNILDHKRVLVITLKAVIEDGVWEREVAKDSVAPYQVIRLDTGNTLDKINVIRMNYRDPYTIFLMTYQTMIRPEMRDLLYMLQWDALVLDEGHMIKSASSAMNRVCCTLGRRAKQRYLLTGTPMPNGAKDVYGLFKFINPMVFGSRKQDFVARYCVLGGFNGTQIVDYKNLDELHQKVSAHSFYIRTRDVLDLPPEIDLYRKVQLEPDTSKLYRMLKKESVVLDFAGLGDVTCSNSLVLQTRLAQIAGGFLTLDDGQVLPVSHAKANALAELVDELKVLNETPRVVVYCRYTQEIKRVKEVMQQFGTVGELSGNQSDLLDWQSGDLKHLVVQSDTGNAGIDLTSAHHVVFFSKTFSLGQYEQIRGRFVRPGQKFPVTFFHLQVTNTIDVVVDRALEDKSDMVQALEAYIRSNDNG